MKLSLLLSSLALSLTGASAQNGTFDFPDTANTSDVAMVSDKAGRFHTIMVRPGATSEALQYYFKDGDTWTRGTTITTASGSDQLTGIDLAIDSTSTLHATYYDRGDVFYATLAPSEADWQVSLIQNGATGTTADLRLRTSIDIRENSSAITPQVAYTRTGSPDATRFGVYAFLDSSGSWIKEDITPAGSAMGARFAVISSEPLPSAGIIFGGQRGPAIAYYENGEYLITQRSVSFSLGGQPPAVSWSAPIKIADGPASTLNSSFFELDFEVANNVSHLICNGTAPDNTSGVLYNRRTVGFGIGIGGQQIISTYENIDKGNSGRREALSLATDSSGTPHACYVRTGSNRWEFLRARRTTTDTWKIDTIFAPQINFAGEPDTAAIALDIFGRPGIIATRENGLDTRATTISDLPLASSTFTIDGETDSTDVAGSLAIDALGGAGFVYTKESDTAVSFRYRSPINGALTTTDLDLEVPAENSDIVVNDALATAFGPDMIGVLTQVTSNAPALLDRTFQRTLYIFSSGQLTSTQTLINRTGFSSNLSPIAIAGDQSLLYIASVPLPAISGNASPPTLYARNLDGSRNTALEEEFTTEIPGGYSRAKLRAEGGTLGIIGQLDDTLSVHFRLSSGRWEDDVAIESAAALPTQYDLAFRPGSAIATYADGNTIYVATSVRSASSPLNGNMPRTRITSTFGGAQLGISSVGNDTQIITRNLGGGNQGAINQYLYDGFPREDASNQKSLAEAFNSAREATFAFDRYGFPAILAVEQSPSPANRLLISSALTIDADGDGMPLFQELALCRNPAIPDNLNTLTVAKTATGSTIAFDRVPGPGTATITGIEAGAFTYGIEFSDDLESFANDNRIIFERTPAAGDTAAANGTRQEVTYKERFPDTFDIPRYFYRLHIGLR